MIGINLAGAEFGLATGAYGFDYIYPNASELDYFKSKGIDLIRLPFRWEHMQTSIGGELDAAEAGRLQTVLDAAGARGMQVVIDLHNYGRHSGSVIGSDALPIPAFADFWSKMATEFGGSSAVKGFGLMNEPHDMGGAAVWPAAAQAAADAIRATGATQEIVVAGDGWSSAGMWQLVNGNLSIADPLNKIVYEAHIYFDRDNTGTYKGTFDEEGVTTDAGVRRLETFSSWLEAHGAKGFIGEFGAPADDPRWLEALDKLVDALHEKNIDGTAWAAGPWWGNYPLSIEPAGGEDKPQLAILTQYLFDVPPMALEPVGPDAENGAAIHENAAGAMVGEVVLSGEGNTGGLAFTVSDPRFEVVSDASGHHLKLLDGVALDHESEQQVTLVITATNAAGGSTTEVVTVDVVNVSGNTITGSSAGDTIDASHSPAEQPFASAEDDVIFGMAGDDTIMGGAAGDWIDGGAGSDTASYATSAAGVDVSLATGLGFGGDAQGDVLVSIENLTGSAFDDVLEGNAAANKIDGGAGIDTVSYEDSAAGVTVKLASTVAQVSTGDAGGDVLRNIENVIGSAFDDSLTGNALANVLAGGDGSDTLNGGTGADTMIGGSGDDIYTVDNAGDVVAEWSGEGHDLVTATVSFVLGDNIEDLTLQGSGTINGTGNALDNVLTGGSGKNVLSGLGGGDHLIGGAGDDTLIGGQGGDLLDGGTGNDTASYAGSDAGVSVSLLTGTSHGGEAEGDTALGIENLIGSAFDDFFEGTGAANKFDGGAGIDTVSYEHSSAGVAINLNTTLAQTSAGDAGGDSLTRIENVTGSVFDDTLTGNSLANLLSGGDGDDVLNGSLGADTTIGGAGSDTYFVDNAGDRVVENAGEGIDSVQSTLSWTLADNAENLTLLGAGNNRATGNAEDNVLTGNGGSNVLSGLEGNDTLIGGGGNDTLSGGSGQDTFVFGPGFGKDTVTDFSGSDGDVVQFDSNVFADFQQVMAASAQVGGDVVVSQDAGNAVTLKGTTLESLHADEFVFV